MSQPQTKVRYPNKFRVGLTGTKNIITVYPVNRSMAKTHAIEFAAWLVARSGDMEGFLLRLIDIWAHLQGVQNVPEWLRALVPAWTPEIPANPGTVVSNASGPPRPMNQGGGGGGGVSRITAADGTPLGRADIDRIANDAADAIRGSGVNSPGSGAVQSIPATVRTTSREQALEEARARRALLDADIAALEEAGGEESGSSNSSNSSSEHRPEDA